MTGRILGRVVAALGAAILLCACETLETGTVAETVVGDADYHSTFQATRQAALSAGFTIISADEQKGTIYATRKKDNAFVLNDPEIWITLHRQSNSIAVAIESAVNGQLIDYGLTRETTEDFCRALRATVPAAQCSYSGWPEARSGTLPITLSPHAMHASPA